MKRQQISNQSESIISESLSEKSQVKVKKGIISNKNTSIKKIQNKKNNEELKQQTIAKKKFKQLQQQKNPLKKIYQLIDAELLQIPKSPGYKIQQFQNLPKRIIKQYEQKIAKDYESNQLLIPLSSTHKILIFLKQIHLDQQVYMVKKIKETSEQSKLIIDDLTNIQAQLDKYHEHIDLWLGRIRAMQTNIEKIKSTKSSFQKRAVNMSKLKDFLYVERTKRR